MCRLTWSSSSLAVLTRGPRTQRLQPNHVIFVSKSSRRINYTQETAEPLGVSPPEAVDLLLIKRCVLPRLWQSARSFHRCSTYPPVGHGETAPHEATWTVAGFGGDAARVCACLKTAPCSRLPRPTPLPPWRSRSRWAHPRPARFRRTRSSFSRSAQQPTVG